ncbi:hypothetical protein ABZP36_021383 [Zizania latifolia]
MKNNPMKLQHLQHGEKNGCAVYVLSASDVSNATLHQSAYSSSTVNYEGGVMSVVLASEAAYRCGLGVKKTPLKLQPLQHGNRSYGKLLLRIRDFHDLASKVMTFSQNGCAVYVLSTSGDVSNAALRQSAFSSSNEEQAYMMLSVHGGEYAALDAGSYEFDEEGEEHDGDEGGDYEEDEEGEREDLVSKVMSFSQNGCAVYVLSAGGDVSNATLRQSASSSASGPQ